MKSIRSFFSIIITIALSATVVAQPQAGPADISITSLSIVPAGQLKKVPVPTSQSNPNRPVPVSIIVSDDVLKCSITIHNNGGGYTRMTTLVVVLPVNVTVTSSPINAVVSKTGEQNRFGIPGCVVFDLFNMSPGQDIIAEFTYTKSAQGNKISAYVYSASPDPDPSNNYKYVAY